jgi:hypothetical protein
VTERAASGRMKRASLFLLVGAGVFVMLGGVIGGFVYRGVLDYRDIIDSNQLVLQSRSENQELASQIADEGAKLAALQVKLKSVQDALDAIMPAENTYSFSPNQSMIVANGNLTIGVIGSPSNEGVNININGKMQSAAAGGAIKIPIDPSTNCQVVVRSFDMFKVVLTASCAAVKPQ